MNDMSRLAAIALIAATTGSAAAAEPFSMRCADGKASRPYFATFDPQTGRLVFESTTRSLHAGDIRSAVDDRIAFSIKVDYGAIELVLERQNNKMIWAGIAGDAFRPLLVHPCAAVEPRTLLAVFADPMVDASAGARPFSLRCTDLGQPYFVTLDRHTKKVVFEGIQGGGIYPGDIQTDSDTRIEFSVAAGRPTRFEFVWDRRDATLSVKGIPGHANRPTKINQCEEIGARSMVTLYDRLR
jgi:hypothetical protein